jgi:hypothetical protein
MARLRCKWTGFWRAVFLSIAEEEMKLRREELEKQFESPE